MISPVFHRSELLLGTEALVTLQNTHVAIVGVGGVGSWCVEALVRSGIGTITIVDFDCVAVSNINRQLPATSQTVGELKVEVLRRRLYEINSQVKVFAINAVYDESFANDFDFSSFDYVIDAIDSLASKVDLIIRTTNAGIPIFSSMGAACKIDPSRIRVDSIWKTFGCPLAKCVRRELRARHFSKKIQCVFSDEFLKNHEISDPNESQKSQRQKVNGSLVHITAVFGMHLSGLVLQDIAQKTNSLLRIR